MTKPDVEFTVESPVGGRVLDFLERQLKEAGKQSVLYIRYVAEIPYNPLTPTCSFGSLCYSPKKHQMLILLDALDAIKCPYILSTGGAPADLLDVLPARVTKSGGRGLLCPWSPQLTILRHDATLAFLTHGGSNSTTESMICGVPLSENA